MAAKKLTAEAVQAALQELPAWGIQHEKLHREYRFPDFAHAFGFMTTAAIEIENPAFVPARFQLVMAASSAVRDCRIAWIQKNRIGLSFVETP